MLPARFDYHRPETLEEALSLLDQYGEDGKILAGGMSFIPLMKLRFASPGHLVDINRITELSGMTESNGWLRVKSVTRHNQIAGDRLIRERYPAMAAAAPQIADPIVRNLGTIGGSLAHADPAGDWGSVMLALEAEVVSHSSSGERTIPIDGLFESTFTTTLRPNEIITEVRVPMPSARSGGAYLKLERKGGISPPWESPSSLPWTTAASLRLASGSPRSAPGTSRPRRRKRAFGEPSPPRARSPRPPIWPHWPQSR